jgi:diguanylate cyclase (GGDEF)-like protein
LGGKGLDKAMQELPGLLVAHGLSPWLERTHSLAALIDDSGRILEWNPAFGRLKAAHASLDSLESAVILESRPLFNRLCHTAREMGQACHGSLGLLPNFGSGGTEYDCSFVPVPGARLIFLAELVYFDPALAESYQRLSRQVAQLTLDNALMKQQLADKQIEIDAVVMQAHEVAHTDDLTFLSNRRQIIGDLQREVMHADRYKTPVSISMLDVDHFKLVNDSYGHSVGDLVLRNVARFLRDNIREPDIVGRYGGEEFLVILPNAPLQAAIGQAERLCRRLRADKISVAGNEFPITISAGVAEYRIGQEDWQKLLSRADAAMYEAKAQGRDRVAASH